MRIGVIGAGHVGTALAVLLMRAGHRIVAVSGREATRARAARFLPDVPVLDPEAVVAGAELVLVTMPDVAIEETAREIATGDLDGRWIAHCSGALGLAPLAPVLPAGGRRLAVHPLQTFPDVARAVAEVPGCTAAVTADDEDGHLLGESIARDLGTLPFRLDDAQRPLYHAAAVFASNDLVVLAAIASRLLSQVGVPDPVAAITPLQRATAANVGALGPADALTGPAVRGDAITIDANLRALTEGAPETVPAYVVLCRAALDLAVASGRLDAAGRVAVEEVLARWR